MRFSFRRRLTFFFAFIVIIPMVTVAIVMALVLIGVERGKTDARLSQATQTGLGLLQRQEERGQAAAQAIAADERLAGAIDRGDQDAIQRRLGQVARSAGAVRAALALDPGGRFEHGSGEAVAPVRFNVQDADGEKVGALTVSMLSVEEFGRLLQKLTGLATVIYRDGDALEATVGETGGVAPQLDDPQGRVKADNVVYRYASFDTPAFQAPPLRSALLVDTRDDDASLTTRGLFVGGVLAAFLILAAVLALAVSRSLQQEVARLLDAARRLGRGDFSVEVPAEGNDEFAALGSEFNAMARQLESRLQELQLERARLQEAIRRVGEAFARGLDRDRLLDVVVRTAVDGVGAECGRVRLRESIDTPLVDVARTGNVVEHDPALHAAEAAVLDAGWPAETQVAGTTSLSHPLRKVESGHAVLGVISVARHGKPFASAEAELFHYLASQAAVSIENVDLHETVQRQAVTDELTGLFNHRRFQEVVSSEVERARRFGHEMGLIMLDIDNFKRVNDTYGHLQGDLVLREVARVLRESSREVDEPARYGGEEMAVALPGTDLEGAYQFAERVRHRIESLELPLPDGQGWLHVTASFGAASLRGASANGKEGLVAAADAALYRAKRSGKNRTVKAE